MNTVALLLAVVKIGIIGLDTSHVVAFTRAINVQTNDFAQGFRVTAAYPRGSKDIESATRRIPGYIKSVKEMGVEIVDSEEALVDCVDCVLLETNDGREHLRQAEKVFRAGKRVFIDKPIAENYANARKLIELGRSLNAEFFSSSALRYTETIKDVRNGRLGKIRTCSLVFPSPFEKQGTHSDYTWYGIHGFESLIGVMGTGVKRVSVFRTENEDAVNAEWTDGRVAQLHLTRPHGPYAGFVMPEKPADPKTPTLEFTGYPGYEPLLKEVLEFFRTGKAPVDSAETLEIFAVMEAAAESARAGGRPVDVAR